MIKEPKNHPFPARIHTIENGTKVNEGVFISWEEHESLCAERLKIAVEALEYVEQRTDPYRAMHPHGYIRSTRMRGVIVDALAALQPRKE